MLGMHPLDGRNATVRLGPVPGFISLKDDKFLDQHGRDIILNQHNICEKNHAYSEKSKSPNHERRSNKVSQCWGSGTYIRINRKVAPETDVLLNRVMVNGVSSKN